jgi:hypothetical protein
MKYGQVWLGVSYLIVNGHLLPYTAIHAYLEWIVDLLLLLLRHCADFVSTSLDFGDDE